MLVNSLWPNDNTSMAEKLTIEQCIDWATPERWRFSGYVSSEEELDQLEQFVTHERRAWLIDTFQSEIVLRSGVAAPYNLAGTAPSFHSLPYASSLSYRQNIEITSSLGDRQHAAQQWRRLALQQSALMGSPPNSSKYNDRYYTDDATFEAATERSEHLSAQDYPVRFLMHGARYVESAAIDLNSVQAWIDQGDGYNHGLHTYNFTGVNAMFWPEMLRLKQQHDEDHDLHSYADVAVEITDGLYHAPYIPAELIETGDYISCDEVVSALRQTDEQNPIDAATRLFTAMLEVAGENGSTRGIAKSFQATPTRYTSGVYFFDSHALQGILEKMYENKNDGAHRKKTLGRMEKLCEIALQYQQLEDITFTA